MTPSDLLSALNWRYATKQFDASREIPAETWDALIQSLVLAPSSFGVQPWRFYVVEDAAKRKQLSEASWGQTQPVDASHYVVFAILKNIDEAYIESYIADAATTRGVPASALDGYRNVVNGFVGSLREAGAGRCLGRPADLYRPGSVHDLRRRARHRHLPHGGHRSGQVR